MYFIYTIHRKGSWFYTSLLHQTQNQIHKPALLRKIEVKVLLYGASHLHAYRKLLNRGVCYVYKCLCVSVYVCVWGYGVVSIYLVVQQCEYCIICMYACIVVELLV